MSSLEQFWLMLQQPEHARAVAYSATLLCVLISAHAAKSLKASPRLFNVMVLFTCAWLVLLGAYATDTTKTAAARDLDLAAILLLYAGGALMQEGRERYSYEAVGWAQDNALKKMIFLALPGGLAFGDFGSQWGLAKLGVSGSQLKIAHTSVGVNLLTSCASQF